VTDAAKPEWIAYSPPWAPHVVGRFQLRQLDDDNIPLEAPVEATCTFQGCGATFKRQCSSGLMKRHIANFAMNHVHRDAFRDPLPTKS